MSLIDTIRAIVKPMVKAQIITGVVSDFNPTDWTCTVLINGLEIDEVRIKSVINGNDTGILIEPAIGSQVVLAKIDANDAALIIIKCDEIVKYRIKSELIELNGDGEGGTVKASTVSDEVQALKDDLNALKTAFTSWVTVPNDGGAALKAISATWAGQQLPPTPQSEYENESVKHG